MLFFIWLPQYTCHILYNENQNLNGIMSCNMYGYNIDAPPISRTMRDGLILILVLWYGIHLCDFSCKYASEMHCLIELLLLYAYCSCCKLSKMCQSSLTCSVILFKFYRDGLMRGVIKCVQLKFHGYFCSTDRMLHKSQNEVASQLFLLHSYHQSKIYGCQDRSELHYMLISFVMSCVTMLLLDKSEHGSV